MYACVCMCVCVCVCEFLSQEKNTQLQHQRTNMHLIFYLGFTKPIS